MATIEIIHDDDYLTWCFEYKDNNIDFLFDPDYVMPEEAFEEYSTLLAAIRNNKEYSYNFGESNGGGLISVCNGSISFSMAKYGAGNGGLQRTSFNANLFEECISKLIIILQNEINKQQ